MTSQIHTAEKEQSQAEFQTHRCVVSLTIELSTVVYSQRTEAFFLHLRSFPNLSLVPISQNVFGIFPL